MNYKRDTLDISFCNIQPYCIIIGAKIAKYNQSPKEYAVFFNKTPLFATKYHIDNICPL